MKCPWVIRGSVLQDTALLSAVDNREQSVNPGYTSQASSPRTRLRFAWSSSLRDKHTHSTVVATWNLCDCCSSTRILPNSLRCWHAGYGCPESHETFTTLVESPELSLDAWSGALVRSQMRVRAIPGHYKSHARSDQRGRVHHML